ncbi:hypothetical protein Tsubulata_003734 [Turnera subulata]|uniref:DUF4283 domain-containing protein n=1 Tax=Turnera subulata TaxID=218843 RepID=A0A9Q0GGW6_9ROSI|nr:hypothetical protein Tsubulata_003734 [Turnera subulata]
MMANIAKERSRIQGKAMAAKEHQGKGMMKRRVQADSTIKRGMPQPFGECAFGFTTEGCNVAGLGIQLKQLSGYQLQVKAMGGNYVLVVFQSREEMLSCVEMVDSGAIDDLLMLREWKDVDYATCRLCWLNIFGVPPQAWCKKFFNMIAIRVKKFIKLANSLEESNNLEVARVEILTTYKTPISRSFKSLVGKKLYDITVCESQPCSPSGCEDDSPQSVTSEWVSTSMVPCSLLDSSQSVKIARNRCNSPEK